MCALEAEVEVEVETRLLLRLPSPAVEVEVARHVLKSGMMPLIWERLSHIP